MSDLVDFILHSDKKLLELVGAYGAWVYGVLFVIVFAETGFVVTPFLPGDSLLFATGALCATGALSLPASVGLLALAAFVGNAVNYTVGRIIGPRVFVATDHTGMLHRLLHRERTQVARPRTVRRRVRIIRQHVHKGSSRTGHQRVQWRECRIAT